MAIPHSDARARVIAAGAERAERASRSATRDAISRGKTPEVRHSLAAGIERVLDDGFTIDEIRAIVERLKQPQ